MLVFLKEQEQQVSRELLLEGQWAEADAQNAFNPLAAPLGAPAVLL